MAKQKGTKKAATKAKGRKTKKEPMDEQTLAQSLNRLSCIEKVGRQLKTMQADLDDAETKVAEAEAAAKDARGKRNEIANEIAEVTQELTKLAQGGFSERFNFRDIEAKPGKGKLTEAVEQASDDIKKDRAPVESKSNGNGHANGGYAWKNVPVTELGLSERARTR